jgi:hypothetical protein
MSGPHITNGRSAPSAYFRLAEAHLSHNRTAFEVRLICSDDDASYIPVSVATKDIPLLVPYLILLRDSTRNPALTELPAVPVTLAATGLWKFCCIGALRDQEPILPEPVPKADHPLTHPR